MAIRNSYSRYKCRFSRYQSNYLQNGGTMLNLGFTANQTLQKTSLKDIKHPLKNPVFASQVNQSGVSASNQSLKKVSLSQLQANFLTNVTDISFGRKTAQQVQLGANYDPKTKGFNFAVFSENATRIQMEIFDKPIDGKPVSTIEMKKDADGKWVTALSGSELKDIGINTANKEPVYYGYRAWGPNWEYDPSWKPGSEKGLKEHVDSNGNRFNPNKLLIDPYCKEITHDPNSPKINAVRAYQYYASGDYGSIDSGAIASKSIAFVSDTASIGKRPTHAFKDDVIYEVHVKGLTKLDKNIPEELRGTYKGAAMKAKELADLGVTAVEFLPVQEVDNDANDINPTHANYWGYSTLNYFAPDRRYAHDKSPGGVTKEFKEMVKAYHDAGIKVYMDVVYNHTGEGGLWDDRKPETTNLFSMKGLDAKSYYQTTHDGKHFYDNTGCGGNMNFTHDATKNLVIDSLKYWYEEMGVDGFRFDLASVLGNDIEKGGFHFNKDNPNNVLNRALKELKVRPDTGGEGIDLIAEPWAIGPGTYQVGHFPGAWAEWNDQYRDTMREAENKMECVTPAILASKIAGSQDTYDGRKPYNSVNFITAHDGFTLKDLHSYNNKNNVGSDGGCDNNRSWDHSGRADWQRQGVRNSFALMMLSAGVPMMVGGDEIMRSTNGNNNPYNLDTEMNWINWETDKDQAKNKEFVKFLINFRKSHPSLRPANFYGGDDENGNNLKDITWFNASGEEPGMGFWHNTNQNLLGWRIDGTEYGDAHSSTYIAYNKGGNDQKIKIPAPSKGKQWYLACDTSNRNEAKGQTFFTEDKMIPITNGEYLMSDRSIIILVEK